ncbi:MAG: hypothetical protein BYD32DRAFT_413560 [Podila humilis]|nr:MAG: hypothetical protein BYD32DRAFT_413560 [Podila humilis]
MPCALSFCLSIHVCVCGLPSVQTDRPKRKQQIHFNGIGTDSGQRQDNHRNKTKCQKPPIWGNPWQHAVIRSFVRHLVHKTRFLSYSAWSLSLAPSYP